jgi:hypothetical protein
VTWGDVMETDRIYSKDAEEAWIAKYRATLRDIPVQQSPSMKAREALNRAYKIALSYIGRIWAVSLDPSRRQRSAQSSESKPVLQPQRSTRSTTLAESNAKVA